MTDPFVAEIRIFGFNFPPKGWAACNGELLPIAQNTALFSLIGTFYGGDGRSTFALPDLQAAVPMHIGANQPGPGLTVRGLGEMNGTDAVALGQSELPGHGHRMQAATEDPANAKALTGSSSFAFATGGAPYQDNATPGDQLALEAVGTSGGSLPHENRMPYLTLNFCIAMQGIFPARP
jgi:microcystin-dependent protein